MISALTDLVLTLLVALNLTFTAGLIFISAGLGREIVRSRLAGEKTDRLSAALLGLCIALAIKRIWWVETFLRFSYEFPASPARLVNLSVAVVLEIAINAIGLYLTWRLYRD